MSMEFIRAYYNVPAKRGARVEYTGGITPKTGVITSARDSKINILMDGLKYTRPYHPTWEIRYLDQQDQKS
jgi:hypothetical protein